MYYKGFERSIKGWIVSESIDMEVVKIEQVIVGSEVKSTSTKTKSEPVAAAPLQSYQHESQQCFQCFITFSSAKAKERHMRKSHREEYSQQLQQVDTIFACYRCERKFSTSDHLLQHQVTHKNEEKPFHCPYCQQKFSMFKELTKHRRHECKERQITCGDCGLKFACPSALRTHRIARHTQCPELADDINTYQCSKCSCGFQTEEQLIQHQEKYATDLNCGIKPQAKKRVRKPKNAAQGGMVDSKKIKEEEGSERHEETLGSKEPQTKLQIPCSEAGCDLEFPSLAALRTHKKTKHGPPTRKPHTCTECDQSFARPEQLKEHTARTHRSEHCCPTCGKSFARERLLKLHQNTHSEGKEVEIR